MIFLRINKYIKWVVVGWFINKDMVTWNNIKIADKGFLINLDERTDRFEESLSELKKIGISGVERFSAIKITEDSDEGWINRGCTQSHCDILKLQVENGWEKVVIFEDDFFLDITHPEITELNDEIIRNIDKQDCDLLMLGSVLLSDSEFVSDCLIKPTNMVQATTYISSLKFAKFVTGHFNYLNKKSIVYGEAIDSYFSYLSTKKHWGMNTDAEGIQELINHDLKIFFLSPILFSQRSSFSNIMGYNVNYSFYNKSKNLEFWPKNKKI